MDTVSVERALDWQAMHAEQNGAPATARVIRGFVPLLPSSTSVGERMRGWPGLSLEDAMPLRLAGGFHNLHLSGDDRRLGPVYSGAIRDQVEVDRIVLAVTKDHDSRLSGWLDGPPQTNEAGRSAGIMAQLLWLSQRLGPRFELNELGASAGINTMLDRFFFELGGIEVGPADSPLRVVPEWRGVPPPRVPVEIVSITGCDLAPIDLTDPEQALRLKSYVWPEVIGRLERIDAAIELAEQQKPNVVRAEAANWLEQRLAAPQLSGVTRVLYHSIVWQYLPPESRMRIEAAMAAAGARATPERPLAWVTVETNRETFRHELRTRYWPGGEDWALLGEAHAHGAWIEWSGQ
ncbi:MAG: DUF2332 domain-containing protein [Novosphingobium sp.]|nr:DUF2332 domain-containing protein [Novosphingobium sp.]